MFSRIDAANPRHAALACRIAALALCVPACGGDETSLTHADAGDSGRPRDSGHPETSTHPDSGSPRRDGATAPPDASKTQKDAALADAANDAASSDGAPPDARAPDAEPPKDAGPACGKPPFITETITVAEFYVTGPLANIDIAVEPCGIAVKTDAQGKASYSYPANLPHRYRLSGSGFITTLFPERKPTATNTATNLFIIGQTFKAARLPDYSATKSEVLVLMGDYPPATNDGVSFTVVGVPGAKITNWLLQTDQMTTTTVKNGYTTITNLPGSGFVTVTASKPGHTVVLDNVTFGAEARFAVETAAVTYVDGIVEN